MHRKYVYSTLVKTKPTSLTHTQDIQHIHNSRTPDVPLEVYRLVCSWLYYGAEHTYLEHEGITKFDCQFKLFDEVWVIEGGYSEIVSLLFLSDPVEGLLLWVNTQRIAGRLWVCKKGRREGAEGR